MKLKEIKCSQCGKEIYIKQSYVREKMFCTLGSLISFKHKD
jgi:formylmethanofuran dehydrogenase subunit E